MKIGMYVVHWSGKVCRVEDISVLDFTGTKREYLILSPVRDKAEKIYVPVEKKDSVLRPVLSKKEAEDLIAQMKELYQRRELRIREGKTLPSKDAQMMAMVEKTFEEEMAIALGVEKEAVRKLIETAQ